METGEYKNIFNGFEVLLENSIFERNCSVSEISIHLKQSLWNFLLAYLFFDSYI